MAKIPRQRGSGQTGNTSWGHRSNRVSSTRRGGNPHAGGGGGGKGGGGICGLLVASGVGLMVAATAFGYTLADKLS